LAAAFLAVFLGSGVAAAGALALLARLKADGRDLGSGLRVIFAMAGIY
jgi:hypothetical protein